MARNVELVDRLADVGFGCDETLKRYCGEARDEILRLRRLLDVQREALPSRRLSETFETAFDNHLFSVSVSRFDDGRLAEIFVASHKASTVYDHLARDTGLLLSIALQFGASLETLSKAVARAAGGAPQGLAAHVLDAIGAP